MGTGESGADRAARRFGKPTSNGVHMNPQSHSVARFAPPGERKSRVWTLEGLLEHPMLRPIAVADAKFHGNTTAKPALGQLQRAIDAMNNPKQED